MEYRIITNDKWIDENGETQIFMQVEINDGTDIWCKAERLLSVDIDRILKDPLALDQIALELVNRAILIRVQEKIEEENNRLLNLENAKQETLRLEIELYKLKNK